MTDMGVTARSSSLEELPSCVLEEIEMEVMERERGRPRSSNDILHSGHNNNVNTLSNLSKLSGWGLSKSYNHSSVVRHIAAAPSIAQTKMCQDCYRKQTYKATHYLAFIYIPLRILTYLI